MELHLTLTFSSYFLGQWSCIGKWDSGRTSANSKHFWRTFTELTSCWKFPELIIKAKNAFVGTNCEQLHRRLQLMQLVFPLCAKKFICPFVGLNNLYIFHKMISNAAKSQQERKLISSKHWHLHNYFISHWSKRLSSFKAHFTFATLVRFTCLSFLGFD